jgi:hypothetical protein
MYRLYVAGVDVRIDPLLLEVSLRENLDPEGLRTDADIWLALESSQVSRCCLLHIVED